MKKSNKSCTDVFENNSLFKEISTFFTERPLQVERVWTSHASRQGL